MGPIGIYYGCDPTADSLHVGNLIGLVDAATLPGRRPPTDRARRRGDGHDRRSQRPLGGTQPARRRDPRPQRRVHQGAAGADRRPGDDESGTSRGELVDNRDWTQPITILEFLRDVGKHVTVNQMLARESVKMRIDSEHGISFTEFSYMLLQANDYLWLHDNLGCTIQIGGSDQWGNIIAGVDLIRRKRGAHVHALLVAAADGRRRDANSARPPGRGCGSTPAKTSPYQFRQHWMQIADDEVRAPAADVLTAPGRRDRSDCSPSTSRPRSGDWRRNSWPTKWSTLVHGAEAADTASTRPPTCCSPPIRPTAGERVFEALAAEIPYSRLTRAELGRHDQGAGRAHSSPRRTATPDGACPRACTT